MMMATPDAQLITAATRIVADAAQDGTRLSQIALAEKLRGQGYSISNHRLRWLSAVSGLESRHGRPPGQRGSARARVHKAGTGRSDRRCPFRRP